MADKYSEAGVSIDRGNTFVQEIKEIVARTHKKEVMGGLGGFASHVSFDVAKYKNPVIVNATDGVGTKLLIARLCGRHDTIGIDLVAMCVNDLIVGGATPVSFLDYFATGRLEIEVAKEVVRGIAEGCLQADCSLVGGETAEMPGMYGDGEYDLAGFATGLVDRDHIIDGSRVAAGDVIVGLPSSGIHSNGYSLVRKICFTDHGCSVDDHIDALGCTLGEELLRPTRIYVRPVLKVLENFDLHGLVHNTGGGFIDNIPRILPDGTAAVLKTDSWTVPKIFPFLQEKGGIPEAEMYRTFNMGIGMMLMVAQDQAEALCTALQAEGEKAVIIGEVQKAEGEQVVIR